MTSPLLYLVNSQLSPEQKQYIINALAIHPVGGVVICDYSNIPLARELGQQVLFDSEPALITKYLNVARELNVPIAILDSYPETFRAVDSDAQEEILAC
jgi:hypothetical protein